MMAKVDEFEDFHPATRREWRAWLAAHHDEREGVWFVYYKKAARRPRVTYDEAVEEALCFGWIDSLPRKIDDERSKLLFTPRKPKSVWSRPNKERVAKLIEEGAMTAAGLAKIERARADGSWDALNASDDLVIEADLAAELAKNGRAAKNFENFSDSVKRGILSWIYAAKTEKTRRARVSQTVSMAAENRRANFDGKI